VSAGLRRAVDLVAAKRDGAELDEAALGWMVRGYLATLRGRCDDRGEPGPGEVSEAHMAALLMAGVCRGFSEAEAGALTRVLVDSGDTLDVSHLPAPVVDKHSTGGVADATTLLVAPLVAAAGATMVKLAGRGLGHTGGTIDKLEAVAGLRADLGPDEALGVAARAGCVVAAQSPRLVPADAALYALRDETATVESPALIAASVMSKKLAAGAPTIVLDVKVGQGAFLTDVAAADDLARWCVALGVGEGRVSRALVTDMDQPLGSAVGNALEVAECARLLTHPPDLTQRPPRLASVALELASHVVACGRAGRPADDEAVAAARAELARRWADGEAAERLEAMVKAQGGDPRVVAAPDAVLARAPVQRPVTAQAAGVVQRVNARAVGACAAHLGAGRARKGEPVDAAVGVVVHAGVGDAVEAGQVLATVHARDPVAADQAVAALGAAVEVGQQPVTPPPLVHAVV